MSTIVDTDTLSELIGASFAAGIGATILFSLTIYGLTRFADARRSERRTAAAVFGTIAAVAFIACVAAVGLGIVVMAQKS
jgi:hypothetical protein